MKNVIVGFVIGTIVCSVFGAFAWAAGFDNGYNFCVDEKEKYRHKCINYNRY